VLRFNGWEVLFRVPCADLEVRILGQETEVLPLRSPAIGQTSSCIAAPSGRCDAPRAGSSSRTGPPSAAAPCPGVHLNPHFHFWWLSPYIEVDLIRHWWRCALSTAGYERSALEHVIVDIRRVKDAEGSAREVIKYVTKDILPDRKLISSELFARVYEAIDGRRMSQPSSGLFKGTEREATCACGAVGCFRRSSTPPADHNGSDGDE
jgi:hypothetical protein